MKKCYLDTLVDGLPGWMTPTRGGLLPKVRIESEKPRMKLVRVLDMQSEGWIVFAWAVVGLTVGGYYLFGWMSSRI